MGQPAPDDAAAGVDALVAALPKAELHVHLEGSIPPSTLLALARRHGLDDLPATREEVAAWFTFRDWAHFGQVYVRTLAVLRDEADFAELTRAVAAGLAAQNVRHAELVVTPDSHLSRGVPAPVLFAGLERGRLEAERQHGLTLRWVADFDGGHGVAGAERALRTVLDHGPRSVVGFGVGGTEVALEQFAGVFARAARAGLAVLPHAGETGGPDNVAAAVEALRATRIGHGIAAAADPAVQALLRERQVPLDICPTSNVRTQLVPDHASHPLPALVSAGLVVTLGTDDPAMFDTDLVAEYRVAHRIGIDADGLVELARAAARAALLSRPRRHALLREIQAVAHQHRAADGHGLRPTGRSGTRGAGRPGPAAGRPSTGA